MSTTLALKESDKVYWHQYINEYERLVFSYLASPTSTPTNIMEFGVWEGASIRYLLGRFPVSNIYGVDIFDVFDKIKDPKFKYIRQDQNDRTGVREMFKKLNIYFDLIIEDGSHDPWHQATCLLEGFRWVRKGGYYIVEDIHSSFRRIGTPTIFHVLLMIKHFKDTGMDLGKVAHEVVDALDFYFASQEILNLFYSIEDLHMIRRSHLPLHCWRCGYADYDYAHLRCRCGEDLYKEDDSMSFLIRKKTSRYGE